MNRTLAPRPLRLTHRRRARSRQKKPARAPTPKAAPTPSPTPGKPDLEVDGVRLQRSDGDEVPKPTCELEHDRLQLPRDRHERGKRPVAFLVRRSAASRSCPSAPRTGRAGP